MSSLHPIVLQLEPNGEQLPAITTRNCDVVVTAGAGAGKTRTLVARYLALLSEEMPLRSIVAITFTQKAAREMRNRIREALQQYVTQPDLAEAERAVWQQRYSELDAARISTIHSLCTDLLRAHPAEAGLDPNFIVLDEGQAGLQQQQVLAEAMIRAAESPYLVPLFELLGERGLADTLAKLLAQRLEARTCFAHLPADLLSVWGQTLTARQEQVLARLRGEPAWQESVACLAENTAVAETDKLEEQRRLAAQALARAVGSLAEQVVALAELDRINLQGGSAKNWPDGKAQVELVKDALRCLRSMWRDQASLLTLTLTPLDEQMAAIIPALQDLFNFMDGRYAALKEELEALDFDDLEDRALSLLQNFPGVQERWQQTVQALLVDEFQDTNSRQRDLLKLLNGAGGKLFIVGDAKQSIYRFRGADVTVFRQERQLIAQNGGTPLTLATSYRAHRDLLEGLNDLLRPVLGTEENSDRPWLEPFARLEPHREQPGAGFTTPHIELHLTVGRKGDGALKRTAEAVVGRLVELVENDQVEVGVGPKARPLTYGDITILCRASTSFGPYEDALEAAGVPFLTVAGRGFYNRPEIRDLLNALQALADPSDDLALAGLLRSPALALSDAALYRLRRSCPTPETSLWAMLNQIGPHLPGEDGSRAERARRLIETLHNQVARITVADLLKEFLDQTGYRAALIGAGQRRAARNVAKLLADAAASRLVSVGAFLEYVNGLRATTAREGEAKAPAEGVVQVMSVHAAKGLEFPIVVLGDITHSQSGRNGLLLDPELGLLLPQKDENRAVAASYRLGKLRADDQEGVESDRLLYVAATRAIEKLLLSGCVSLNKDGALGSLDGWLKRLTGPEGLALTEPPPDYNDQGSAVRQVEFQIGQSVVGCHFYEPLYQPSISAQPAAPAEKKWSTPLPPDFLAPIVSAQPQPDTLATDRPQRVWRVVPAVARPRAPAWVVGQLVHAALAAWRFPDESFEAWALAQARNYGLVDERQLAHAVQESQRLLHHFQTSDLYREMNQAEQRLHEVPYSWELEGRQESGILDALFRNNGTWTVVEFKTDRVWDEVGLNRLLAELDYLSQVQRYTEVVKHMLDQTPQAILCWLNFGDSILIQEIAVEAQIQVR
ncbi:MAG: UvrD-helicase domain-containing protein [Anaerolineae bacterium]|nr:UvrD-helicase domain-containing protein [Anaerolineae bacterium]